MKNNIKLEELGNKMPFTVPENYFEDFATQFENQIENKKVPIVKLLKPWMYMAAMFIAVFYMSRMGYTAYQDKQIANAENYEMYVMSQVDDVENLDYYLTEDINQ